VAFPLTDLRSFYLDRRGRVSRPRWPTPRTKEPNYSSDFVRGVGAVSPRPRGGITGRAGEDVLCNAEGAITFPAMDRRLGVRFRSFFADGAMFARLSVGLTVYLDKFGHNPRYCVIDAAVMSVLSLPTRVGPARHGFPRRGLIFVGSDLARYLQYRTTIHNSITQRENSERDGRKRGRLYMHAEPPVLLFEAEDDELLEVDWYGNRKDAYDYSGTLTSASPVVSLASSRGAHIPAGLKDVVAWTAMAPDGGLIRCFLLVRGGSFSKRRLDSTIRALRIYLLRLIIERQNIRRLFEWLDTVDHNDGLDGIAIERAFVDAEATLRRLETKGVTSEFAEYLAKDYIERVHPGESDSLRASIDRIFTRRTVRAKAHAFLDADQERTQVVQFFLAGSMGVGRMGDDFRGSNITAAAVGSGAKATNTDFQNVAQQSVLSNDLSVELVRLVDAMRAQGTTPGQEVATELVGKAAEAAREGKNEHVLAYLKSAGAWALQVAEKIGVELAKTAISKALGVP
jgi:hypothetical protein